MYFKNLKKLETLRKSLVFSLNMNIVLFFVCIFLWLKITSFWWIIYSMCAVVLLIFININLENKFYRKFLDIVINPILNQYNLSLLKSSHKHIKLPYITNTTSINAYYIQSDDFCIYDIKTPYTDLIDNVKYQKQNTNLFKLMYDKHKSSKQVSFNGLFIVINKTCKENIKLIGHSNIDMTFKKPLLLDNVFLNELFDIYSDDKVGAFKVLTPSFSQSLVNNIKVLNTAISIILNKDGAFLFISSDFLHHNIYKKLNQKTAIEYNKKLQSIIEIIKLIKKHC